MLIRYRAIDCYALLFAVYLGIAPLYWGPGIQPESLAPVKAIIFIAIAAYPAAKTILEHRLFFPGGKPILIYFLIFFTLCMPALIFSQTEEGLYRIKNFTQIFLFLNACGFIIYKNKHSFVAFWAVSIFLFFAAFTLTLMMLSPDTQNPYNKLLTIKESGLGSSRTGWSPTISLYMPWLYSLAIFSRLTSYSGVLVFAANQGIVFGRSGILASLSSFAAWIVLKLSVLPRIVLVIFIFIGIFSSVLFAPELFYYLTGHQLTLERLNVLSSYRLEQYFAATNQISKTPLFGTGFGNFTHDGFSIHNSILRFSTEAGLLAATGLIILFMTPLIRGFREHQTKTVAAALLTILSGLVVAMFEPQFIFGNFNIAAFWWFCFAICVSSHNTANTNTKAI